MLRTPRNWTRLHIELRCSGDCVEKVASGAMQMRRVPELAFIHDETPDRAGRIDELLRELEPDERGSEGAA